MKVAVVGAGYAGLAVVWNLLQKNCDVTVFDEGSGASHVSSGLLHKSPGKKAIPCDQADEGMAAALELLKIASQDLPVFEQNGIMRYAINEEQRSLFGGPTFWNPEGITVYSRRYLQELKKVCRKATFIDGRIENLDELKDHDAIILTVGSATKQFADLPLKTTIGQCLVCRWPERLPYSLLAQGHITPTEDSAFCQVGSTYEHTPEPDPQKALALIDKIAVYYPPAKEFKIEEIRSGVRIAPKIGYSPLIQKIAPKTWVFTGLGSRGLLYHALYAKSLIANHLFNI